MVSTSRRHRHRYIAPLYAPLDDRGYRVGVSGTLDYSPQYLVGYEPPPPGFLRVVAGHRQRGLLKTSAGLLGADSSSPNKLAEPKGRVVERRFLLAIRRRADTIRLLG